MNWSLKEFRLLGNFHGVSLGKPELVQPTEHGGMKCLHESRIFYSQLEKQHI